KCEEELGVSIDTSEIPHIQTIHDLYLILSSREQKAGMKLEDKIFKGPITTTVPLFFNPFHHIGLSFLRAVSVLFWRVEIVNRKALDNANCIIAANHQSYLDIVWIGSSLPHRQRKHFYTIGKKKLSFFKYFIPMLPALFVEEGNTFPSLKGSADVLRLGKSLVIFPEGTRSPDGQVGSFRTGAAYLAKNLGKKIIPVSIIGAHEIYPKDAVLPRFFCGLKGRIVAGDPIDPSAFATVEELNSHLRSVIIANTQTR
ncbi:MAG: lysophospholipid acyltransferase family protein, partial [Spirochaetota bacterium]